LESFLEYIIEKKSNPDVSIFTSLLELYLRSGESSKSAAEEKADRHPKNEKIMRLLAMRQVMLIVPFLTKIFVSQKMLKNKPSC
jgi:hypothetical protein